MNRRPTEIIKVVRQLRTDLEVVRRRLACASGHSLAERVAPYPRGSSNQNTKKPRTNFTSSSCRLTPRLAARGAEVAHRAIGAAAAQTEGGGNVAASSLRSRLKKEN